MEPGTAANTFSRLVEIAQQSSHQAMGSSEESTALSKQQLTANSNSDSSGKKKKKTEEKKSDQQQQQPAEKNSDQKPHRSRDVHLQRAHRIAMAKAVLQSMEGGQDLFKWQTTNRSKGSGTPSSRGSTSSTQTAATRAPSSGSNSAGGSQGAGRLIVSL